MGGGVSTSVRQRRRDGTRPGRRVTRVSPMRPRHRWFPSFYSSPCEAATSSTTTRMAAPIRPRGRPASRLGRIWNATARGEGDCLGRTPVEERHFGPCSTQSARWCGAALAESARRPTRGKCSVATQERCCARTLSAQRPQPRQQGENFEASRRRRRGHDPRRFFLKKSAPLETPAAAAGAPASSSKMTRGGGIGATLPRHRFLLLGPQRPRNAPRKCGDTRWHYSSREPTRRQNGGRENQIALVGRSGQQTKREVRRRRLHW